jgi:hypothetical protein
MPGKLRQQPRVFIAAAYLAMAGIGNSCCCSRNCDTHTHSSPDNDPPHFGRLLTGLLIFIKPGLAPVHDRDRDRGPESPTLILTRLEAQLLS